MKKLSFDFHDDDQTETDFDRYLEEAEHERDEKRDIKLFMEAPESAPEIKSTEDFSNLPF